MQFDQNPEDLLSIEVTYERAGTGKRLANYLIDLAVFYIFLFGLGIILGLIAPATLDVISNYSSGLGLVDRIITLLLYGTFMSLVEGLLKGKSVGKLITKTRAVNIDGSQISISTAFARGFSRAVPFCVFSAFGTPCNPWQDRWTNTMVIDENK